MNNTIKELYDFQKLYLNKILENIPEEKFFLNQEKGINSPGWILGHLIVESECVLNSLEITSEPIPDLWKLNFQGSKSFTKSNFKELPTKKELIEIFEERYDFLLNQYLSITDEKRMSMHTSEMLSQIYTNTDSWFAHHIITHIAVHIGNITIWKQVNNIAVQGF